MTVPPPDETDLPELLASTLIKLRAHAELLDGLAATGGTFNFFVGWFSERNSGARLEWSLLREMAELRISLDLDIYGTALTTDDSSEPHA